MEPPPTLVLRLPRGRGACGGWLQQRSPDVVATIVDAVELLYIGFLQTSEDEGSRAVAALSASEEEMASSREREASRAKELSKLRSVAEASEARLARQAWMTEENERLKAELAATSDAQLQLRLRLEAAQQELRRMLAGPHTPPPVSPPSAPRAPMAPLPFLRRDWSPVPSSSRMSRITTPALAPPSRRAPKRGTRPPPPLMRRTT